MATTLTDLADLRAIAVAPPLTLLAERVVEIPLAGDLTLPLLVLWPAGLRSPAVDRLRAAAAQRRGAVGRTTA